MLRNLTVCACALVAILLLCSDASACGRRRARSCGYTSQRLWLRVRWLWLQLRLCPRSVRWVHRLRLSATATALRYGYGSATATTQAASAGRGPDWACGPDRASAASGRGADRPQALCLPCGGGLICDRSVGCH